VEISRFPVGKNDARLDDVRPLPRNPCNFEESVKERRVLADSPGCAALPLIPSPQRNQLVTLCHEALPTPIFSLSLDEPL
jgi:hypothetical protein